MRFFGLNLDFLGFSASFLCAVHCISLPLILSLGLIGGSSWLVDETIELVFVVASIAIATYALGKSYFKEHKQIQPLRWAFTGILFLVISRFLETPAEHYLTALGGFSIAYAHYINWKFSRCLLPGKRFA
jgi:hypothetical protein